MIKNGKPLEYNPDIAIVGFNVENGDIVSEKLYHEKDTPLHTQCSPCQLVTELIQKTDLMELFSVENASENEGVIKYDFKIKDVKNCKKIIEFFVSNVPYFAKEYISVFSQSIIVENTFYIVGIRIKNKNIYDLEFYFRRKASSPSEIDSVFSSLLSKEAFCKLKKLFSLISHHESWLKLIAIDYQKETVLLKFYFETNTPVLYDKIIEKESDSYMRQPLVLIRDFTKKFNLRFIGMAIAIDLKTEQERFNYYFEWDE